MYVRLLGVSTDTEMYLVHVFAIKFGTLLIKEWLQENSDFQ